MKSKYLLGAVPLSMMFLKNNTNLGNKTIKNIAGEDKDIIVLDLSVKNNIYIFNPHNFPSIKLNRFTIYLKKTKLFYINFTNIYNFLDHPIIFSLNKINKETWQIYNESIKLNTNIQELVTKYMDNLIGYYMGGTSFSPIGMGFPIVTEGQYMGGTRYLYYYCLNHYDMKGKIRLINE
jgi:hypothetical protein